MCYAYDAKMKNGTTERIEQKEMFRNLREKKMTSNSQYWKQIPKNQPRRKKT